ncbi:hypothetical protein [Algoriphagus ornithinivorans]|nr:hypothetical protein [Algoriphagus ornithinivorans]
MIKKVLLSILSLALILIIGFEAIGPENEEGMEFEPRQEFDLSAGESPRLWMQKPNIPPHLNDTNFKNIEGWIEGFRQVKTIPFSQLYCDQLSRKKQGDFGALYYYSNGMENANFNSGELIYKK